MIMKKKNRNLKKKSNNDTFNQNIDSNWNLEIKREQYERHNPILINWTR